MTPFWLGFISIVLIIMALQFGSQRDRVLIEEEIFLEEEGSDLIMLSLAGIYYTGWMLLGASVFWGVFYEQLCGIQTTY